MQFYKGVTLPDIIIGLAVLGIVALIVTSNLPYKLLIAIGVVCLSVPFFIPIGEEKIYMTAWNLIRYILRPLTTKTRTAAKTVSLRTCNSWRSFLGRYYRE